MQFFNTSSLIFFITILSINGFEPYDPNEPLFLTPYIEAEEQISEVRELARVDGFEPILSYSGFVTVNSTYNSNLFFWFFPAEGKGISKQNTAPVILWNDGGPGSSCVVSVFGQNGPFIGSKAGNNHTLNSHSWHKKYNMIYIDIPVEVGFSFTENEEGYVRSAQETAELMYEFLRQFFIIFPELQENPFYTAGVSYGSSYAIQMAYYIHQQNQESSDGNIRLTGSILDSPWIEAESQIAFGNQLYMAGLISDTAREHFLAKEKNISDLLKNQKYDDAYWTWIDLIINDTISSTGFAAHYNIQADVPDFVDMTALITTNRSRTQLHVGELDFKFSNMEQQQRMAGNIVKSSKPEMQVLLNAGHKFLLYVGNMDVTTSHIGVQKVVKSLTWGNGQKVDDSIWIIWRENEKVVGYNLTSGNLTLLIIRNVGHGPLPSQPAVIFKAVQGFLGEDESRKDEL